MLDEENLIQAVHEEPLYAIQGAAFRIVKLRRIVQKVGNRSILTGQQALSTIGSRKIGGRYNPSKILEALYLADTPHNAFLEVDPKRKTMDGAPPINCAPRIILTVEYQLQKVLDVTNPITQNRLGTNPHELTASGWRELNDEGLLAPTQILGIVVYQQGIEAMKVPSAIIPGAHNLVIFPDRLLPNSYVTVFDEDDYVNATLT